MCDDLDKGRTLDELFRQENEPLPDSLTPEPKVKRLSPRVFRITLGFHGGLVGDGGTWRAVYTASGKLLRVEGELFWTC